MTVTKSPRATGRTLCCHLQEPSSRATSGFPLLCENKAHSADVRSWACDHAARAPFQRAPCQLIDGAALTSAVVTTEPGWWPETEHPGGAESQEREMQLPGEVRNKHNFLRSWAATIILHFLQKEMEIWLPSFNFISLSSTKHRQAGVSCPLSCHQKLAATLKGYIWVKEQTTKITYKPAQSLEKQRIWSDFLLNLIRFQSRPFLHFNTSVSMWTLQFGSTWWGEAAKIFSELITVQLGFPSRKKTSLHFLRLCKRPLPISKHTMFKKVVTRRSDSVPPNSGISYWRCDFFLPFLFTSSTLYLKTCSLYCFIAKTVCKARIVLIASKLINITCFSIISTIWACWKP